MPTNVERINPSAIGFDQIKQNWMGEWQEGTIYRLNDTVRLNGKAYVCNTTYLNDNLLYGYDYRPGQNSEHWKLVVNGSVYKGDWAWKDYHYEGDIVRWNEDYYICLEDNFNGHPVYENGEATTKWKLYSKSSRTDKSKVHIWFGNYPPMGWTRNMGETWEMYGQIGYGTVSTINGNFELCHAGYMSGDSWGIGEHGSNHHNKVVQSGFDFWDWKDGRLDSPLGSDEPPRPIQMCGTGAYMLCLFDNGELYHTGYGGHGQSGDGTTNTYRYWRRVGRSGARGTGVLRDVKIIKTGHTAKSGHQGEIDTHSCFALDDQGQVWTWGYNGYGQLGHGNTSNYSTPTKIPQGYFANKKIVDMWMTGYNYQSTFAMTDDGDLYAWGYNGNGQLGIGHAYWNFYRPERIKYNWKAFGGIKKTIGIMSGSVGNLTVLTNNGQLHMVGEMHGTYGPWGLGGSPDNYTPYFQRAVKLYQDRDRSNGIGNEQRQSGIMWDVMDRVEDFWNMGNGDEHAIFIKEKGSGNMYGQGWTGGEMFPIYHKQLGYNEHAGGDQYNYPNISGITRLHVGNFTDVKHMHKHADGTEGYCTFMNRDGRMWNGCGDSGVARGIGNLGGTTNPTKEGRHRNRLPWEHWFTDESWAQVRFAEPVNMVTGWGEASAGGWNYITTNGRLMVLGGDVSYDYALDPANGHDNVSYGQHNPTRMQI
jgi:hypothetical protein